MTAFTVWCLVLKSGVTYVGGDSTYVASTCFPVLGGLSGLGARHSHVHFRNLLVSLPCAGERRSRGVRRNAKRVWDGGDSSWVIRECLVLHVFVEEKCFLIFGFSKV
jgi:hypothetical protein